MVENMINFQTFALFWDGAKAGSNYIKPVTISAHYNRKHQWTDQPCYENNWAKDLFISGFQRLRGDRLRS